MSVSCLSLLLINRMRYWDFRLYACCWQCNVTKCFIAALNGHQWTKCGSCFNHSLLVFYKHIHPLLPLRCQSENQRHVLHGSSRRVQLVLQLVTQHYMQHHILLLNLVWGNFLGLKANVTFTGVIRIKAQLLNSRGGRSTQTQYSCKYLPKKPVYYK